MAARARRRVLRAAAAALLAVGASGLAAQAPAAAAVGAAFVQAATAHTPTVSSLAVTPASPLGTGDRLVVEVGVWSSAHATASAVTDAAGDTFTELTHFIASDGTEESVWTAPVTAGAGTKPAVTATASRRPPTSASPSWSTRDCPRSRTPRSWTGRRTRRA